MGERTVLRGAVVLVLYILSAGVLGVFGQAIGMGAGTQLLVHL